MLNKLSFVDANNLKFTKQFFDHNTHAEFGYSLYDSRVMPPKLPNDRYSNMRFPWPHVLTYTGPDGNMLTFLLWFQSYPSVLV